MGRVSHRKPVPTTFVSSGLDGTARIWDWNPSNNEEPRSREIKHASAVNQARWSQDGKLVATVTQGGDVCLWDAKDPAVPEVRLPMPDANASYRMLCCAFAPTTIDGGRWLFAGGIDQKRQASIGIVWRLTEDGPVLHCVVPG